MSEQMQAWRLPHPLRGSQSAWWGLGIRPWVRMSVSVVELARLCPKVRHSLHSITMQSACATVLRAMISGVPTAQHLLSFPHGRHPSLLS